MKNVIKIAAAAAALFAFAGAAHAEGDADKGKKVFNKCKACHRIGDGAKNAVGPVLTGVVGRTIGTYEGYKYSKGYTDLGAKGDTWDDEKLMAYLDDPSGFLKAQGVDGKSKMTFKLPKEDERADVIAYLKTFSAK